MDKEYIKMVLALPEEFFKDWKWQVGDRAISTNHDNKEAMVVDFDVWTDPKVIHVLYFGMVGYTYLQSLDFLRPLPSQRQLQEMLINFHMKQNGFSRKRAILHIIGHWADYLMSKHDFEWKKIERNENYDEIGDPDDFDILMLKFTVGIILMLEWDFIGEKWR